jgi:hypothetical protein
LLITFEPIGILVVKKAMKILIITRIFAVMKKMVVLVIFSLFSLNLFAPVSSAFLVKSIDPVNPFGKIINAIGKVETGFDTLAYNPKEEAVGYFQIRPIRLKDYNNRTGSNYKKKDLYDYFVSEKIFLYYASQIGPYNLEKIAKNWNGSGIKTKLYWKNVRKYL